MRDRPLETDITANVAYFIKNSVCLTDERERERDKNRMLTAFSFHIRLIFIVNGLFSCAVADDEHVIVSAVQKFRDNRYSDKNLTFKVTREVTVLPTFSALSIRLA